MLPEAQSGIPAQRSPGSDGAAGQLDPDGVLVLSPNVAWALIVENPLSANMHTRSLGAQLPDQRRNFVVALLLGRGMRLTGP